MARFVRARSTERDWVQGLPDRFTLDELTAVAGRSRLRPALSWLYDAIARGRIEPMHNGKRLTYVFVGGRRAEDAGGRRSPTAMDRPPRD